jgi:glucokinase
MYVGIDIGGTKTLVAALNEHGVIKERVKFPTPQKYENFLGELQKTLAGFTHRKFLAGAVGMPVTVFDRKHGTGVNFGNLAWRNVPIQQDLEMMCDCLLAIENDAKLGGLSESMLLKGKYSKVLYVTVSTGIGIALVTDNIIDTNVGDGGGKTILLDHQGKLMPWESFASGHAIVERYGKRAMDITDEATWKKITRDLSLGLIELIAITEPDVIVIGGSVGTYFDRYGELLDEALQRYHLPLVTITPVIGAQRAEDAVVYGCYDLARQVFGNAGAHHTTSDKVS